MTFTGCDNGTLAQGWGSGTVWFPYLIDVCWKGKREREKKEKWKRKGKRVESGRVSISSR
jgi:hypothetical protein